MMSSDMKAEPLLACDLPDRPVLDDRRRLVLLKAGFTFIGLASSILWNTLLLSVSLLIELFGDSVVSTACLAQNIVCATTMVATTIMNVHPPRHTMIYICDAALLSMTVLGGVLIACLHLRWLPLPLFCALVALNGFCTGIVQIFGASLSGLFSALSPLVPTALLVGEAASPLAATFLSLLVDQLRLGSFQATILSLCSPLAFLVLGMAALRVPARVSSESDPQVKPLHTIHKAGRDPNETEMARPNELLWIKRQTSRTERIWARVATLTFNAAAVFIATGTWCFALCVFPHVASALCESDGDSSDTCVGRLTHRMIAASNIAAFAGRIGGGAISNVQLVNLVLEAFVLAIMGGLWVGTAEGTLPLLLAQPLSSIVAAAPLTFGVVGSGAISLWANALLARLSLEAQSRCNHSNLSPCPFTMQVSFASLQLGALGGTGVSFF